MRKYLQNILNLRENADFEKTKSTIREGASLRGHNCGFLSVQLFWGVRP